MGRGGKKGIEPDDRTTSVAPERLVGAVSALCEGVGMRAVARVLRSLPRPCYGTIAFAFPEWWGGMPTHTTKEEVL
jgi:hypothetical protein